MTPADPRDAPPTEPLPPRRPHARETVVTTEAADALWVQRLEDQVRSLKGLVALLGVLAAVALGVAAWALLADDDGGDGGGRNAADAGRVARLDDRVDALEDDLARVARRGDASQLADDVAQKADQADLQALSDQVDELAAAIDDTASADTVQAVADLQARVDTLAQDLEALSAGGP